jgi:hypothetical protein
VKDDHLPAEGQFCCACWAYTDHLVCWDTDLDLADVSPQVALHDAALAVTGEAA